MKIMFLKLDQLLTHVLAEFGCIKSWFKYKDKICIWLFLILRDLIQQIYQKIAIRGKIYNNLEYFWLQYCFAVTLFIISWWCDLDNLLFGRIESTE